MKGFLKVWVDNVNIVDSKLSGSVVPPVLKRDPRRGALENYQHTVVRIIRASDTSNLPQHGISSYVGLYYGTVSSFGVLNFPGSPRMKP